MNEDEEFLAAVDEVTTDMVAHVSELAGITDGDKWWAVGVMLAAVHKAVAIVSANKCPACAHAVMASALIATAEDWDHNHHAESPQVLH